MSLRNAVIRLFTRKATREAKESMRRDSDRVDEAQKKCARVSLNQKQAADELSETLMVNETLHANIRSKMPTRKLLKEELDEETGTARLA